MTSTRSSAGKNSHGHAGPRRNVSARQAVLDAADDLLVERGFAGVTIEGIASRAGVAKQTIYRWWKSKVEILLDNLEEDGQAALAWEDGGGEPLAELTGQLVRLQEFLRNEAAGAVMHSLIGQALHDADTAQRFREGFLFAQRQRDLAGLRAVLERLDCAPTREAELADLLDRLLGPLYYRSVVLGISSSPEFLADVARSVVGQARREHG
ncbi:TetR/AcrR family transcriptional regulator [Amycolatopsis sp. NPDC051128]|uniref:TetR/AcrR family transcriptional regulator n=1 Tax=Amycolatopsis sp. NPDC051128 TaxID=3155412 RepID=UPI00342BAC50